LRDKYSRKKKQCYDGKKCEYREYRVREEGTEETFERAVVQLARPRWKIREKGKHNPPRVRLHQNV
jgi:hypothetical protein